MKSASILAFVVIACWCCVGSSFTIHTPDTLSYPSAHDFVKVGLSGLDGDRGNSYPWTLFYFKGKIVSCTLRHAMAHLPSQLFKSLLNNTQLADSFNTMYAVRANNDANGTPLIYGSMEWADQLAARCYTLDDSTDTWNEVFKTPVSNWTRAAALMLGLSNPQNYPIVHMPEAAGIRWGLVTKTVDNQDDYLYLMGVGAWSLGLPWSRVYRTNDLIHWEDWTGDTEIYPAYTAVGVAWNVYSLRFVWQPRDIIAVSGKICVPGSVILGAKGLASSLKPTVHCRDPSVANSKWQLKTILPLPGRPNPFPDSSNAFQTSHRFAGKIVWGMQSNSGDGVSLWWTQDGFNSTTGMLDFHLLAKNSMGDLSYSTPLLTNTCGDNDEKLMVGLSNGAGYYFDNRKPVLGTRGSALYSFSQDLTKKYVVGDMVVPARNSPTGNYQVLGWPASNMFAGLNNPANHYFWISSRFKNLWFMGTFDITTAALYTAGLSGMEEEIASVLSPILGSFSDEVAELIEELFDLQQMNPGNFEFPSYLEPLVGGDVWVTHTNSCSNFSPVTLNGFGNNFNYGARTMLVAPYREQDACLFIGFANPFSNEPSGGAEVYRWCPHA